MHPFNMACDPMDIGHSPHFKREGGNFLRGDDQSLHGRQVEDILSSFLSANWPTVTVLTYVFLQASVS